MKKEKKKQRNSYQGKRKVTITIIQLEINLLWMRNFTSAIKSKHALRTTIMHYAASSKLVVISVYVSGLIEEALDSPLLRTKAGSLGIGTVTVSLSSMVTTFDMVGRSLGSSCMHRSPTFTHFVNRSALQDSCRFWSIKSNTLVSVHNLHA